ncbi:type II toxin-antitoxin system HipA family toxin [Nocardia miyunensis]|uniref:type II toxin-antitoxin system HipA family toxin n=1 Tax=Nocardia miyunensis TaxID=282684 RepID=UPI000835F54C|nr:type II toxin-antitoxin system HipA family toxin [Nocardia miyunensis]
MSIANEHQLYVVMNGRVIGDVQRTGKRRMRLRYSDSRGQSFTPLSVSMPGPIGRYRESILDPWLSGLLPDRPETLRQWRRQFGISHENDAYSLLRHVGEDLAGAAQFVRPERLEAVLERSGRLIPLDGPRIAEMLRRAKADLPVSDIDNGQGKFSLAGAQAKIALHRTEGGWTDPSGSVPSTHILKPAIPGMTDQDLVEAVTLRTASYLELSVAKCSVEEFGDERAIVVERYDRAQQSDGRWIRVHQEDMCQALGMWPTRKYESQGGPGAVSLADLIRRESRQPSDDVRRLVRALIFNWLVCGTDAHARNYSLLLSGQTIRLAPLYDLNSHLAYSDGSGNSLSMSVGGMFHADRITVDNWVRFAPALHIEPDWLRNEIDRQRESLLDAMAAAAASTDIAIYDSPAVRRLLSNTADWMDRRFERGGR